MSFKTIIKKIHSYFNYHRTIKLGTKTFKIPIIHHMGLLNLKVKDSWFMTLVQDCALHQNSSFLDIGVNVGQTLLQFRAVSDAPYWGFEPNSACVYYLNSLIEKNAFLSTHIIPAGLSSDTRLIPFYLKHASDSAGTIINTLRPDFYNSEQKRYVPVFEFDSQNFEIESIGLIKIDVEGAELEVLTGMQKTLALHQPPVICEILDAHSEQSLKSMQNRSDALLKLMQSLNYDIYRIHQRTIPVQYERINQITLSLWTPQSAYLNDYLFWPKNKPFIYKC